MHKALLYCFAFFPNDSFVAIANALALVGCRRIKAAYLGCDLPDHLPVRPFNGQLGVLFDGDLDLIGNVVNNRMGVAKTQIDLLALNGSLETDSLDFELFDKAFADSADHIIDQRSAQAVKGLGAGVVTLAADDYFILLDFEAGAMRQFPGEFAFRPLDVNLLA